MTPSEYQTYLASREWALLREAVRQRSGNKCERCQIRGMDQVHHLTYERVGGERLTDLQGICSPCHEYLSGKRGYDPRPSAIHVADLSCPRCLYPIHVTRTEMKINPGSSGPQVWIYFCCEICAGEEIPMALVLDDHSGTADLHWRRLTP